MIKKTDWKIRILETSDSFKQRLFKSRALTKEDISLSVNNLHDYSYMNDMDVATFETYMAVKTGKRIGIFGDYDVDGVMSTNMLMRFFASIGYPVDFHIPDRLTEGYGISDIAADNIIKEHKYDLIITVDNGIAAINQIKRIMEAGIRVVVTDHHECKEVLPPACAVVDCKRPDNTYPFRELCGAGVVLKFIQALCDEFGLPQDTWKEYIEYAAIATVADVVPLIGENRIIVGEGIKMIKNTKKPSILNLLRVSKKLEKIDTFCADDIAFYIAPLINASSRIGSVDVAMNLMLTNDSDEAIRYADELNSLNEERKEIELKIYTEANQSLINTYNFNSVSPIIVYGNEWHRGVIGIVASRLVDNYSKPTIILSKTEDGMYHGSCRTYGNINIIKMLDSAKEYIKEYGGHESAAGLTVEQNNLECFIKSLNEYAIKNFNKEMFLPVLNADMTVKIDEITLENYNYINDIAPFGEGNKYPAFVLQGVKIAHMRKMGNKEGAENAHMKIEVSSPRDTLNQHIIEGVGFFNSDFVDIMKVGDIIDIMFKPSINEWNGKITPTMIIQDIHCEIPQREGVSTEENMIYLEDEVPIGEIAEEYGLSIDEYIPNKNECFNVYRVLCSLIAIQSNRVLITDLDILSIIVGAKLKNYYISPFKLARIIEINAEAGYFYYKKMLFGKIFLSLTDGQNIIRVAETQTYKNLEKERDLFT